MIIAFEHPSYFAFLFVLPLMVILHFFGIARLKKSRALMFANFEAISRVKGVDLLSKSITPLILNALIVSGIIFALAQPIYHTVATASFFSYVIAIDSSSSMVANDLKPSRIEVAKESALNFVDSIPKESYVGIVSFSGNSIIEQQPTKNKDLIKKAIREIEISSYGGTDVQEAIAISSSMLKDHPAKAILLFSDGQVNVGDLQKTMSQASDDAVVIHTFGLGTKAGGVTEYGVSKIDEETLKSLSYNTGGKYFNVSDSGDMSKALGDVLQLTKKPVEKDLSIYLLIGSIIFFIILQFLYSSGRVYP